MRRVVALVCLVFAASASASPRWPEPVAFTDPLPAGTPAPALGVTGGGTRVVAWLGPGQAVLARVGDGPVQTLGSTSDGYRAPMLATGAGGRAVVAWSDHDHVSAAVIDGGAAAPAVAAAPGDLYAVRMNAAGDIAVLGVVRTEGGPYGTEALQMAFRPAGGQFGAAVSPGAFQNFDEEWTGFALTPAGEALLLLRGGSVATPGALDLYSRIGDGPLQAPYRVADSSFTAGLAADGAGRVLVLSGSTATIRGLDGTWRTVPGPGYSTYPPSVLGLSDGGDLVETTPGLGFAGHSVAPPLPPDPPNIVTGSLDAGAFSGQVQLPGGRGNGFAVATAPNGSTVIAYQDKDANTTWVVQRFGTGPFSPPQAAACGQTGPSGAGITDDGLATLLIGSTTVTETTGADQRACPPRELAGRITYRPADPVVGRPVTITVHRLHGTGSYPTAATFRHGADSRPMTLDGTAGTVRYAFPKAGRAVRWSVRVQLRGEGGTSAELGRHVTVRVLRR